MPGHVTGTSTLVPTLRVGMHMGAPAPRFRHRAQSAESCSHAEHGNEKAVLFQKFAPRH